MRIVIISGRSGSGKSVALNLMEDAGFYCIDNMPASLLPPLVENMTRSHESIEGIAISIDARNTVEDLVQFPKILEKIKMYKVFCEVVFLDAQESILINRFSETRRKHPLSDVDTGLREAIVKEKKLLEPISILADVNFDTSDLNLYDLRDLITARIVRHETPGLALLFQSFGFKHGIPIDADFVFDVRCLPNPYWNKELRAYSGLDLPVVDFLGGKKKVVEMQEDIQQYLERWLPEFSNNNRTYLTVAIGCTGGHHRSVYLCEALKKYFLQKFDNVQVMHRELKKI